MFIFLWVRRVRRVERGEGGKGGEGEKSERGEEKKGGKSQKRGEREEKGGKGAKKEGKGRGEEEKEEKKVVKCLILRQFWPIPRGKGGKGEKFWDFDIEGGIERGENPPAAEGGRKKSTMR